MGRSLIGCSLVVIALGLAGCGSASPGHGIVTGGIVIQAGVIPGDLHSPRTWADKRLYGYLHQAGIVDVFKEGHVVSTEAVRQGQAFRFDLSVGRYEISAHAPGAVCEKLPVAVRRNDSTPTEVVCPSQVPFG